MRRWGWWIAGGLLVAVLAGLGWAGYARATAFESLARSGRADVATALDRLQDERPAEALAAFERAAGEFAAARELLGPGWLRGTWWLGRQLDAADDLATIGLEGSRAGAAATRVLTGTGGGTADGENRLGRLLRTARPHLDEALVSLVAVSERAGRLDPDGLVGPLAGAVAEAREELEPLALVLSRSRALLDLERYLFSGQHRFLVLAQNNAQLRPTGGFPGTYGLVSLGPDGFTLEEFADIYDLPEATIRPDVPDGWRMRSDYLRLRTANWWLDFPTSAELVTRLWSKLDPPQPAIDGVIAIDLPMLRGLLEVLGPIRVPQSKVALTADNVVEQLGYIVEVEHSGQGYQQRKSAVISLAAGMMGRLTALADDEFAPVLGALAEAANTRHVQVFLTDQAAQRALVTAGWSGAIAPAEGTTDLLAVSNAVVGRPGKGNLGVSKSISYDVVLDSSGSARTSLRLGYRMGTDNPLGAHQTAFPNQVRVHRIAGTALTRGRGVVQLEDATGLPTFSAAFELPLGASTRVEVEATVPDAVREGPDGQWRYRLLVAKQADLVDARTRISVSVPDGWRVTGSQAAFRASGRPVEAVTSGATVSVATALEEDLTLDVVLARD